MTTVVESTQYQS